MEGRRFAEEGYPRRLDLNRLNSDNPPPDIIDARSWSHEFGQLIHARLCGEEPAVLKTDREFDRYRNWVRDIPIIEEELLGIGTSEEENTRNRMEVNFHSLNLHMQDLWTPFTRGRWKSERKRQEDITIAQDSMALVSLRHYKVRQDMVEREGDHILFDPEYERLFATITGVNQEYDVMIVLLDFMRQHPNITIVPAPMQFERGPHNRRRNVDFLVVNWVENRVVGVQVKTNVRQEVVDEADKDRVVFVDVTIDLGNVRVVRVEETSSRGKVQPWAGIIATKRVTTVSANTKTLARSGVAATNMFRYKTMANQLVGNIRVDYSDLVSKIDERILRKL